jgi:hypothetical protein
VAVEEKNRRPRAPVPDPERRLPDVDEVELEPLEHGPRLPAKSPFRHESLFTPRGV